MVVIYAVRVEKIIEHARMRDCIASKSHIIRVSLSQRLYICALLGYLQRCVTRAYSFVLPGLSPHIDTRCLGVLERSLRLHSTTRRRVCVPLSSHHSPLFDVRNEPH